MRVGMRVCLSVLALWWTSDLSKAYPAFVLRLLGNPECSDRKRMDRWMKRRTPCHSLPRGSDVHPLLTVTQIEGIELLLPGSTGNKNSDCPSVNEADGRFVYFDLASPFQMLSSSFLPDGYMNLVFVRLACSFERLGIFSCTRCKNKNERSKTFSANHKFAIWNKEDAWKTFNQSMLLHYRSLISLTFSPLVTHAFFPPAVWTDRKAQFPRFCVRAGRKPWSTNRASSSPYWPAASLSGHYLYCLVTRWSQSALVHNLRTYVVWTGGTRGDRRYHVERKEQK